MLRCALLDNRGILRVTGPDRFEFLQGLISNDIYKLKHQKAIYTLLLSPQGKFQYDMFIIQIDEELWIEAEASRLEDLKKRLNLFKLKSSICLDVDKNCTIFACWGNTNAQDEQMQVGPEIGTYSPYSIAFNDPRLPELGVRVIHSGSNSNPVFLPNDWERVNQEEYRHLCLQFGVPLEEDMPVDKAIPLECGLDELNAIDWNKGCYMGQELTARTRYRGLIRKRLIPCSYNGSLTESVVMQNDREVGEIRSQNPYFVMVLLRLEALQNSASLHCGAATLTPHIPYWVHLPEGE